MSNMSGLPKPIAWNDVRRWDVVRATRSVTGAVLTIDGVVWGMGDECLILGASDGFVISSDSDHDLTLISRELPEFQLGERLRDPQSGRAWIRTQSGWALFDGVTDDLLANLINGGPTEAQLFRLEPWTGEGS